MPACSDGNKDVYQRALDYAKTPAQGRLQGNGFETKEFWLPKGLGVDEETAKDFATRSGSH